MQEELRQCQRDRDEALQRAKDLEHKVFELEVEADTKAHSNDKSRQLKLLEVLYITCLIKTQIRTEQTEFH